MDKDRQMSSRDSGGGAAAQSGITYQNRVAAWIAVHILAEQAAHPPWEFAAATTIESLLGCVKVFTPSV